MYICNCLLLDCRYSCLLRMHSTYSSKIAIMLNANIRHFSVFIGLQNQLAADHTAVQYDSSSACLSSTFHSLSLRSVKYDFVATNVTLVACLLHALFIPLPRPQIEDAHILCCGLFVCCCCRKSPKSILQFNVHAHQHNFVLLSLYAAHSHTHLFCFASTAFYWQLMSVRFCLEFHGRLLVCCWLSRIR